MIVKDLIRELKKLPQDLPIRIDNEYPDGENEWIVGLECSETGDSGYELEGEVRLLTSLKYMSLTKEEMENLLVGMETKKPKML